MGGLLQWLIELDNDILLGVNGWLQMPFFDHFMYAYSGKWVWIPMYLAIWYVMLRNFSFRVTLLCMLGLGLTITFADQLGATVIRPLVERMRPSNPENPISPFVHIVNGYRGGAFGFPSCHAANTFGLAFFIQFLFRKQWLTLFMMGWAILTCYSRMHLGVHYLGDLLAGVVIGFAGACLMYYLFRKVSKFHRSDETKYTSAPIYVGLLTIAGITAYSGIMSFY